MLPGNSEIMHDINHMYLVTVEAIRRTARLLNSTRARQIVVGAENARRKFDRDLESERYPTIVFTSE
jgi:hypothetical protein